MQEPPSGNSNDRSAPVGVAKRLGFIQQVRIRCGGLSGPEKLSVIRMMDGCQTVTETSIEIQRQREWKHGTTH